MDQSSRTLVLELLRASQRIQFSDLLQQLQKNLLAAPGEDSGVTQKEADPNSLEMVLKVLPVVTDLLNHLHTERQEHERTEGQLLTKQTDYVQKIHRLEELHSEIQAKAREIQKAYGQLEGELETYKTSNKNLEKDLAEKTEELQHLKEEHQGIQRQLEDCRADCLTKEERLAAMQLELTSAQSELSTSEKEKARLVKENRRLKRSFEIVREQEEEVHNRLIVNKQATAKLEEKLLSKEDECRSLTTQVEQLQAAESSMLAEKMAASNAGVKRTFSTVSTMTEDSNPVELRVMVDLLRDAQAMSQDCALIKHELQNHKALLQQLSARPQSKREQTMPFNEAALSTARPKEHPARLDEQTGQSGVSQLQQGNQQQLESRHGEHGAIAAPLPQNTRVAHLRSQVRAQPLSVEPVHHPQGELVVPRRDISTWPKYSPVRRHSGYNVDESLLDDIGPVKFPPGTHN